MLRCFIMSEFSNRFRQLKDEHDLTLKELSDELDISTPNLSYYMKGREPSYDILIKIADYFNVTTDWLIGRTDARNVSQESLYEQVENALEIKYGTRIVTHKTIAKIPKDVLTFSIPGAFRL